ncbi:hypothetical protein GOP47_0028481 [Adiantum capillus-veneris]|nr:hypothetical protein GOP47_0028481 [Adiantum capillus-veneris]
MPEEESQELKDTLKRFTIQHGKKKFFIRKVSNVEIVVYEELKGLQGQQLLQLYDTFSMEDVHYGIFEFHDVCSKQQMKGGFLVFITLLLELHRWGWLHNKISPQCFCFASDRFVILDFQNASRVVVLHSKVTEPKFRRPYLEAIPNNIFAGCFLGDVIYGAIWEATSMVLL